MLMQSQAVVPSPASSTGRKGFTLIELLVVMGIMVLLVSLGIGASLRAFSWVQKNSTEILLRKVQERMARRYEQIVAEAKAWDTPPDIYRLAGGNPKRAEALKIKLLCKWNFPMTYEEVERNVIESRQFISNPPPVFGYNYAPQGYPFAVALQAQLNSRVGNGATLANRAPLLAATGMTAGDDLLRQNAAILLAVFESTLGTSVDELVASEIGSFPSGAPGTAFDTNPILIDIWGTPLFFMRYGNLATNVQRFSWLPLVLGPLGPPTQTTYEGGVPYTFDFAFYGNYYSQVVNRAKVAFPSRFQRLNQSALDPDDPESTLTLGWRTQLHPFWRFATPIPPFTTNGSGVNSGFAQSFGYVMTTFGISAADSIGFPRMYTPLVILSAGQDRRFSAFDAGNPELGWEDNLDSYRNSVTVGQQQ